MHDLDHKNIDQENIDQENIDQENTDQENTEEQTLRQRQVEHGRLHSFDGTPIAFTDHDEGGPAVLLVNGLGGRAPAFAPLLRQLPNLRALSWDYRGLFGSGRPVRGYAGLTVQDHARDGLALLDALDVERAHVLGWSMGVQVGLEMAVLAPERVESLALMGGAAGNPYRTLGLFPTGLSPLSRFPLGRFSLGRFPLGRFSTKGSPTQGSSVQGRMVLRVLKRLQRHDRFLHRAVHTIADADSFVPLLIRLGLAHHDVDREVFYELAQGFKELDLHLYFELLQKLGEHDARSQLDAIDCKTLIMVGSEDALTPLAAARELQAGIRGAALEVIAGATHYAAVEMPDVLAGLLRSFWELDAASSALLPRRVERDEEAKYGAKNAPSEISHV